VPISDARARPVGSRLTVEGTVTTEPGLLLGERTAFLEDGTGGIAFRLPDGWDTDDLPRGTIVQVTGRLAAPWGNQELRPDAPADLYLLGTGGLPDPTDVAADGLAEAREGRLARIRGSIEDIDGAASGAVTLIVRTERGDARVYLHATLRTPRSRFTVGAPATIVGIVGQRESRRGAGDGYRLWPRDAADLTLAPVPAPTPQPTRAPGPRPTSTPRPRPSGVPGGVTRIGRLADGTTATVEGLITTEPGLLDSDGRRVTIQDATGGILLRLPEGVEAPPIGRRIRVTGEVGTYYGAAQLEADAAPQAHGRGRVRPIVLRRAPSEEHEWRLVRLIVRIVDVSRDGDSWRAEATLGAGGSLPIVGLAGAGIDPATLVEGRGAVLTGIVKRAHPSATDQRFGVVPRSADDLRLGPEPVLRDPDDVAGADGGGDGADGADGPGDGSGDVPVTGADPAGDGASDIRLDALAAFAGRRVRVAGSLQAVTGPRLRLDDGSATGVARLVDAVAAFDPPLTVGEVLNVTGVVTPVSPEEWEVVARAADVIRSAGLPAPSSPPVGDPEGTRADLVTTGADGDAAGAAGGPDRGFLVAALLLTLAVGATPGAGWLLANRLRRRPGADEPAAAPSRGSAGPGRSARA
jgi:DNA/RNA endonuclease YhcR with UshA esterase domain